MRNIKFSQILRLLRLFLAEVDFKQPKKHVFPIRWARSCVDPMPAVVTGDGKHCRRENDDELMSCDIEFST